jgi:uncharacterized protein YhjY with autotransporter beta-barrel domain
MKEAEKRRSGDAPSTLRRRALRLATAAVWLLALLLGTRQELAAAAVVSTGTAAVSRVSFNPTTVAKGGTSALTVTLSATGAAATLTEPLVDTLPIGLSAVSVGSNSCSGGSVSSGGAEVTLSAGATIPANASCTFTVTVKVPSSSNLTYFTDVIPASALVTNLGPGAGGASGKLTLQGAAVVVPSVAGLSQTTATSHLAAIGLAVSVVPQYSPTVAKGVVIGTQPAAGASAAPGTSVQLLVSLGPGTQSPLHQTPPPGLTSEQQAVWHGLTQTCAALAGSVASLNSGQRDLLEKCTALIDQYESGTNLPGLAQALDSISGRQATASVRIPMQFAAGEMANLSDRLGAVRAGSSGIDIGGLEPGFQGSPDAVLGSALVAAQRWLNDSLLGGGAGDDTGAPSNRLGVFVTGTLRRGSETATDAEQGFDFKNTGLTAGVDYRFGDSFVLGLAGAYGKSTTTFDETSGELDAKHDSGSLYGSYFTGPFHVDFLLGMGHNTYDLGRDINYSSTPVPGTTLSVGCNGATCATNASGSTGAREYNSSIAGGADFHSGALEFGPVLEVQYKQVGVDGYSELGPSGLNLNFGAITSSSLVSKAGGYANWAIKTRWGVIVPQVQARYLHEFMNDARTQDVQFAEDTLPGAASRGWLVYTDRPDRDYMDYKASILFQFPFGIAAFVDYSGIAGYQDIRMHEVNVGLRIEPGLL